MTYVHLVASVLRVLPVRSIVKKGHTMMSLEHRVSLTVFFALLGSSVVVSISRDVLKVSSAQQAVLSRLCVQNCTFVKLVLHKPLFALLAKTTRERSKPPVALVKLATTVLALSQTVK